MNIAGIARFSGPITEPAMREGLDLLQSRHPALRTSIVEQKHQAFFQPVEVVSPIPLEWKSHCEADEEMHQAVLASRHDFLKDPAPLARVHVLQYRNSPLIDVVLVTHHSIADGQSYLQMFRELACHFNGSPLPEIVPEPWRPPAVVPSRQGIFRPILKAIDHGIRQDRKLRRCPLADPRDAPREMETLRRIVCDSETTARLRDAARREQTTITGALAAASVKSLAHIYDLPDCSAKLCSPVNVRTLCDPPISPKAIGCYAAMVDYVLYDIRRQPFWELARLARQEIQRFRETGLWAVGWKLLGWWLHQGGQPRVQPMFCNLNNLGTFDGLPEGPVQLEEYSWTVNQHQMASNVMLAAITIQGRLNLTLRSPWHSPAQVEALLVDIIERLKMASNG